MLKFDHIAVSVSRLEQSLEFYKQLGFVPDKIWQSPDAALRIALMKNGNAILELFCYKNPAPLPDYRKTLPDDLQTLGCKHFALATDDIVSTAKKLSEAGIADNPQILKGRLGRDYFFIRDPDGILIEIIQG
ncbi:MAG: VOC family protein [Opitutales bacterium]|nr:VOC family protein [Opitutales bacterium]